MKNYLCLIISHGDLAFELNQVAQNFLTLEIPVYLYSNKKDSIEKIILDAGQKISAARAHQVIIFVDLVGGSCWHAALSLKKNHQGVACMGGINLPALVSLATNVNRLDWQELLAKIEEDAHKGIKVLQ